MLYDSVQFKDTGQVIGSEFALKVKLLDWVKSIPGRVHRDKYGELRSFIKAIDHRRCQYPAKVGRGRMRGDNIR
jgi:hypothetical protein